MISFLHGKPHARFDWDTSSLSQVRLRGRTLLEDQAVSFGLRDWDAQPSVSLLPLVQLLQARIEFLEHERDSLLAHVGEEPTQHFNIPLQVEAILPALVIEEIENPFFFFGNDEEEE